MSRRRLNVGPDGLANVMVLTDPIPRHLSIVSWGANDRPAVSWKSEGGLEVFPEEKGVSLRSPPPATLIQSVKTSADVAGFVNSTLDIWRSVVMSTLGSPLPAAERAARITGLTAQAGARVAAFVHAVGQERLSAAVWEPAPTVAIREQATMDSEVDRQVFQATVEDAATVMSAATMQAVKDHVSTGFGSTTEAVLTVFSAVGEALSDLAGSIPDGIVGVRTERSGRRNSSADEARLRRVVELMHELLGDTPAEPTSTEKSAMTIDDLKRLASEHPGQFLETFKMAFEAAKKVNPSLSMKFAWGETGVDQYDAEALINALRSAQSGEALASLIAAVVGGVDVDKTATGDSPQVAATMRSALSKHIASEISRNPNGELAAAVKGLVAPDVAKAIVESIKAALNGTGNDNPAGAGFGLDSFESSGGDGMSAPTFPQLNRLVAG